jgi:hypothetical protein
MHPIDQVFFGGGGGEGRVSVGFLKFLFFQICSHQGSQCVHYMYLNMFLTAPHFVP